MFNPVSAFRYLLPTVYLSGRYRKSRLAIQLSFYKEQCQYPVGPYGRLAKKNGKSGPFCWEREVSAQFAQQLDRTL